jgi:hypothetical protein
LPIEPLELKWAKVALRQLQEKISKKEKMLAKENCGINL